MGHAFQSPLRRWEVLAGLAQSINAKTFVEVGCKDGQTTGFMLANLPEIEIDAIDPWEPVPNSAEDYKDWDFERIEREFWQNVGEHRDRVEMWRNTSLGVATVWQAEMGKMSEPIDMVFIDAAHDYDNALADIKAWWPLVREGGMLALHDYQHKWPGVMRAVAKCFPLIRVAVCPDSIAVIQKDADVRLQEAA